MMGSGDSETIATGCNAVPFPASPLDFTRGPFSKNGRTHVESRCNQCGFRIVGRTFDEFDDQEREHAARCMGSETE